MLLLTLWVNTKLKFSVPRAGCEMPSIFCSTNGPSSVSVVVPEVIDVHGQASLRAGSGGDDHPNEAPRDRVRPATRWFRPASLRVVGEVRRIEAVRIVGPVVR